MDQITTNITTEPSPSDRYQHHHHQHQHLHHINKYNTQHKCSYTHTHTRTWQRKRKRERESTARFRACIHKWIYKFNDRSIAILPLPFYRSLLYLFVIHIIIWVAISFLMGSVCILLNRHFGMYCEWVCWKSTDWKWNLLLLIKMHFINKCALLRRSDELKIVELRVYCLPSTYSTYTHTSQRALLFHVNNNIVKACANKIKISLILYSLCVPPADSPANVCTKIVTAPTQSTKKRRRKTRGFYTIE